MTTPKLTPGHVEGVPDDFSREFEAMYNDPTVLHVASNRFRLWCLMSAVQLASRHPEGAQTTPMKVAVQMARRIQTLIATTPALARVAEQGWDQTHDR